MTTPSVTSARSRLETLIAYARILERVERSPQPVDADQYQLLVQRLKTLLATDLPPDALHAILSAHPATAELYENLTYGHAGLTGASLDRSVATEQATRSLLARLSAGAPADRTNANGAARRPPPAAPDPAE